MKLLSTWRAYIAVFVLIGGLLLSSRAEAQTLITLHPTGCGVSVQALFANGDLQPPNIPITILPGIPHIWFPPPLPGGVFFSIYIDGVWYTPPAPGACIPVAPTVFCPTYSLLCRDLSGDFHIY